MLVVIDFRLQEKLGTTVSAYMEEFALELAKSQPDEEFIFLSELAANPAGLPENLKLRVLKRTRFPWFDQQRLVSLLRELKAARYLRLASDGFRIHKLSDIPVKNDLIIAAGIISFTSGPGHPAYLPPLTGPVIDRTWVENERTKTTYTGGRDFFLFTGELSPRHGLIDLLKGFSIFKNWQQSGMQLVLAGDSVKWTNFLDTQLETYKYREDVVLLEDPEEDELKKLSAACYAMLYPVLEPVIPVAIGRAIQGGRAMVASDLPVNRQAGYEAIWVDNINIPKGFSDGMLTLYKNEDELNRLAAAATAIATEKPYEQVLSGAWDLITLRFM